MSHQSRKLFDEALRLPASERSRVAAELLASLEGEPDDVEQAWAEEILKRIERNAPGIPAEQVFAEGRSRLTRKQ